MNADTAAQPATIIHSVLVGLGHKLTVNEVDGTFSLAAAPGRCDANGNIPEADWELAEAATKAAAEDEGALPSGLIWHGVKPSSQPLTHPLDTPLFAYHHGLIGWDEV